MQGFAKDISLLVPGTFPSTVSEHMLRALNIVQGWHRAKNPSATSNKTGLVLFSEKGWVHRTHTVKHSAAYYQVTEVSMGYPGCSAVLQTTCETEDQ
jgi:hypothetical protein